VAGRRLVRSPKRIYCTVAASACNSRRALVTGVIFTLPLHAVRALVRDGAPFRVAGLKGMARPWVHAQNCSYDSEGKHRFEQTHHLGTSHHVESKFGGLFLDRPRRREAAFGHIRLARGELVTLLYGQRTPRFLP
jgi:hypothetical protein